MTSFRYRLGNGRMSLLMMLWTQTLQTLKQDEELKRIPVLAFANHEEVDTWRAAKELGIDKIVSRNEFSARTLALLEEVTNQSAS